MKKMKRNILLFALINAVTLIGQVARPVANIKLTTLNKSTSMIPYLGEKVVMLIYIDPDVQKIADPVTEAVNAKKYPVSQFSAVGVINAADTWIPNSAILVAAEKMQRKYPQSLLMIDKNRILSSEWKTGDANDKATILVIGKDMKIKFLESIRSIQEAQECRTQLLLKIEQEMK